LSLFGLFSNPVGLLACIMNSMFLMPAVNYVPGTPSSLSGLTAEGIRRMAWEAKLRRDSVRPSVFEQLKSGIEVVGNMINVVKSGIFMKVEVNPDAGQSCRLSMSKPLRKAPQLGNTSAILGNEDEQDLVWVELYYNEIKKGVKYKKWGYDYNDTKYLKYIESYAGAITDFMSEYRDTRIHQALTLTYGEELTHAPVSRSQQFNKNWCIPNADQSDYPAWDITDVTDTDGSADADDYYSSRTYSGAGTFVENIAAALLSASGVGSTSKALFTVDFLSQLSYYLSDELLLEPIILDGVPSYIILVASNVWNWSTNPNNSGSFGEHFQAVSEYKDPKRMTLIGELGRAYGNLVFVRNMRAPTLTVSGTVGSYSLRVNYVNPGNNDDRNKAAWSNTSGSQNYVYDMCYALGMNALAEYDVDPINSNLFENTEYGQVEGRACYTGNGIQIPQFDKDAGSRLDGTSTTAIQRGSALIPVSRAPIQTIS